MKNYSTDINKSTFALIDMETLQKAKEDTLPIANILLQANKKIKTIDGEERASSISKMQNWIDRVIKNKNEKVKTFSKGMVQRLGIAQAIIHSPKILILDEPMSGLDPIGRKMVKDMILEYRKSGKTVLFSTHNLDDIEALCDEVIMIKEGSVVLNKNISSLRSSNSYRFEIVKDNVRNMFLIKGREKFWEFLKNIKDENQEIISIKSDLSSELEQYYEK
jgi:ABC-type multidrug transport system ATPase subunit